MFKLKICIVLQRLTWKVFSSTLKYLTVCVEDGRVLVTDFAWRKAI